MNGAEDHQIVTASSAAFPSLGIGLGAPGMVDTCTEEAGARVTGGLQAAHGCTIYTAQGMYCTHVCKCVCTVSACNRLWYCYVHYSNGTQGTLHLDTHTSWGHIDGQFMGKGCKSCIEKVVSLQNDFIP